jgi:hypothetical protein
MERKSKSALTGGVARRQTQAFVEPVIMTAQILYACLSDVIR